MSSIKTRKTKARFVFTLFSKLNVEYNSQPKMCCKFCKWTVTKNATRMANHIISTCKSCPADIKKNVYIIQTKDIKHPHLPIKDKLTESKILINDDDDELTRISTNTSNNDIEDSLNDASNMTDDVVHEEIVEYDSHIMNHSDTHNYSKPNHNLKSEQNNNNNKYNFTIIPSNNDTNLHKFKLDSTLKSNESTTTILNDFKHDEYKKESRAFGNWVTSEIDDIGDLEILNQMKHDISNILYNSKKEYLKKLKQSVHSC